MTRLPSMLVETRQQPVALERTLERNLRAAAALRRRFERRRPTAVVLAARGTSDNAALFGRYLIEITTGIPVSLAAPSIVTLYQAPLSFGGALVVGISQSGESTDINAFLEAARASGADTLGITNEAHSAMARVAEHTLLVRAGREKSVAATKTYTGQMMAFYLLAYALGAAIELDDLRRIPAWTAEALSVEPRVAELAPRYRFMDRAISVGRGLNYANALELSLKLMETCYVVAERFSAADLLHGPVALLEPGFPLFVFAPPGPTAACMTDLLARVRHLRAEALVITDRAAGREAEAGSRVLELPLSTQRDGVVADLYTAIPYIVPAQLLAVHLALEKGLDPDRPRTLHKVTLTL